MRRMMALSAILSLLVLAALPPVPAPTPGMAVNISGPEKLEAATEGSYNVKVFGPSDITWGFWVNVSGSDYKNAKLVSPDGQIDSDKGYRLFQNVPLSYPEFNFTLIAPPKAGTLTLTVTVNALEGANAAGQTATNRWSVDVKAKREVTINATVSNSGGVPVDSIKVSFLVRLHGVWTYIGNETIPRIDTGKRENVSTMWNSTLVDDGEYTVRVIVDPDHEKPQFTGASNIIEKKVMLKAPGTKGQAPPNVRLIGFIAVLAVASAVGYIWYRKKKIV